MLTYHVIYLQDVDEDYSVRYPKLYTPGLKDLLFNTQVFLRSVLEGVLTSLVLFFIPYGAFYFASDPWGKDVGDLHCLGVAVASILIVAVNIRVSMKYQTETYTGYILDICWMYTGYMSDMHWIYAGYTLDICRIHTGYMPDTYWLYA